MIVSPRSPRKFTRLATANALLDMISTGLGILGRGCAWLSVTLVITVFTVVVLRYLFATPSIALQESALWQHNLIFMLGAAYTLNLDEHVRVDIFYRDAGPRYRAWVDLIGTLVLLLPLCGFLFWYNLDYVELSWRVYERSADVGGLPGLFVLKSLLLVLPVLLAIQGLGMVIEQILLLSGAHRPAPARLPHETEL